MKIYESQLPNNLSKGLIEDKNMDLAAEHTDKILYVIFTATANLLNHTKRKETAVSFEFNTIDGRVIAAAIVKYFPNEDPAKPGNWSMVWTFDEKDIPENAVRMSIKDVDSHSYFKAIAGEKWAFRFKDSGCLITLLTYTMEQLKKWLDENASESKEVSIEQDAVFQARVAVENGEKVFALEPAGEIKMLIKDDAAIEK